MHSLSCSNSACRAWVVFGVVTIAALYCDSLVGQSFYSQNGYSQNGATSASFGDGMMPQQSPQPQWQNASYAYSQDFENGGNGSRESYNFDPSMESQPRFKERLAERGVTLDFFATQFYQGVASGGVSRDWAYGGKLDLLTNFDGQKVGLWQGFFVDLHVESRLGKSVNGFDGLLAPSNIAMAFPEPEGNVVALTGLKVTQALSENFAIYAGKINTLDEFPIRYNSGLGLGRPGIGGFMNTSLVFNPIVARTVPYATAGIGFAILQEMEPVFTFTVFDPTERATTGIQNPFEEGVVLVPDFIIRSNRLGLPGVLNFGGTWSSATYTALESAAYLNLPHGTGELPTKRGSWAVYGNFYQALWQDHYDQDRTWGIFGLLGLSDGNPNPIKYSASVGLGGRVMNHDRPDDTFGIGLFHLGLSSELRELTEPIIPQRHEYGLEWFYNRAITKNIRASADLQVVRPSSEGLDVAIIPGVRLEAFY